MATLATYRAINPVTISAAAGVTIPRGARASLTGASTNECGLAGATVRGDYIAMQDIAPGTTGSAVRMGGGEVVGLAAAVTIAATDTLYAAANGTFSNTGTVIVGKPREAAASGTLFGVFLTSVL